MKQNNLFSEEFLEELQQWQEFVPQEFFSWLFKKLGIAHRSIHLKNHPHDKGNGFYRRTLQIGGISFPVEIARTRHEKFRPFFLPPGNTRYLPEDYQNLAYSFLLGARSIQSAFLALKNSNLPINHQYLEEVIKEFVNYLKTLNSSPLPLDLAAVILDGTMILQRIQEGEEVREYTTYVAIGLSLDGRKIILGIYTFEGKEKAEHWQKVLEKLVQRGLRRVLVVVHDDFSGLLSLSESYFPGAEIQLCTVHLLRNAERHLSREYYLLFRDYWQAIKNSLTYEEGKRLFEALLEKLPQEMGFVRRIAKRKEHYLVFLKYPRELRSLLRSTNIVEGINRKIEDAKRNSGGYFHSERDRDFRYGILAKELLEGRWRRANWKYRRVAHLLRQMFQERFSENDY